MAKLSKNEQDSIVAQLGEGVETLTEEEFDELYDQLDAEHQMEVDDDVKDFANGAVGSDTWDSDEW